MAGVDAHFIQTASERPGDDLGQLHGRSARSIFLETMMGLDDLDIEVVAEQSGDISNNLEQDVDADAHVWRKHAGELSGQLSGLRHLLRGEAG